MFISALHIPGTNNTPDILMRDDGFIRIKGRGLRIESDKVPDSLWNWLNSYIEHPAEVTIVILALEILNSLSTSVLMNMLKTLMSVAASKKLIIYWYYENDDHDMLERGEYFSNALDFPLTFVETEDCQTVNHFHF